KMMTGKTCYFTQISQYYWFMGEFGKNIKKTNIKNDVCLHSEINTNHCVYFASFKMLATLVLIKSIATILLTPSGITISA
ncbi:hypothetical protein OLX19_10365, partial [Streptococcus agalactiae]|nr:hypothetical protein [Streptococcus agalactiae]